MRIKVYNILALLTPSDESYTGQWKQKTKSELQLLRLTSREQQNTPGRTIKEMKTYTKFWEEKLTGFNMPTECKETRLPELIKNYKPQLLCKVLPCK